MIRYTIEKAGEYTLDIQVQPGGSGPSYPISDSPLPVTVAVDVVSIENTVLAGTIETVDAVAGIMDSFSVTLYDSG